MVKTYLTAAVLAASCLGLSACGGGGANSETTVSTTTTGQELTDLQAALESGAITQEEFDKKKKEILKE